MAFVEFNCYFSVKNWLEHHDRSGYPPDEFYTAQDFNEQNEHYIYVTYPPELKRRLLERYGRDIYLMLLKKDLYD